MPAEVRRVAVATAPTTPLAARWQPWRLSTAALLVLLALWLAVTAGLRPLMVPDEGRYANVARDLLLGVGADDGHGARGWVPLLNGLPFFHKPPLMYWLDMAAMAVFGANPWSARFGALCGAWLMGASLYLALRRWHGAEVARRALLLLATSPFFFFAGQFANLDMLVGGLISASVLAFVRAFDGGFAPPAAAKPGAAPLRWLCAAWALAALAVLAKGLIGVVLPLLVVGPWLLAQRRWRDAAALLHPAGLALFALIALPWFVAMQWRYPGFFDYFVVEQHFRRYLQTRFNNRHGGWFYPVVLLLLTLPASLWLPAGLGAARRQLQRWQMALYVWWVVAVLAFFSVPSSKLVGYVLPATAPWCVLLSLGLARRARAARIVVGLSIATGLGAVALLVFKSPHSAQAAGQVLGALHRPGERVVFVGEMFYDLPFYAGLREPPTIAGNWADPALPLHDNWRLELADAARFDARRGAELLWPIDRLAELTCGARPVWFVVRTGAAPAGPPVPGVPQAVSVHADATLQLLRAPGRACPPR